MCILKPWRPSPAVSRKEQTSAARQGSYPPGRNRIGPSPLARGGVATRRSPRATHQGHRYYGRFTDAGKGGLLVTGLHGPAKALSVSSDSGERPTPAWRPDRSLTFTGQRSFTACCCPTHRAGTWNGPIQFTRLNWRQRGVGIAQPRYPPDIGPEPRHGFSRRALWHDCLPNRFPQDQRQRAEASEAESVCGGPGPRVRAPETGQKDHHD